MFARWPFSVAHYLDADFNVSGCIQYFCFSMVSPVLETKRAQWEPAQLRHSRLTRRAGDGSRAPRREIGRQAVEQTCDLPEWTNLALGAACCASPLRSQLGSHVRSIHALSRSKVEFWEGDSDDVRKIWAAVRPPQELSKQELPCPSFVSFVLATRSDGSAPPAASRLSPASRWVWSLEPRIPQSARKTPRPTMHESRETIFIMEPTIFLPNHHHREQSWLQGGALDTKIQDASVARTIELPMLKVDPSQSQSQKQRMSLSFIVNEDFEESAVAATYHHTFESPRVQVSSALDALCAKKNCYHQASSLFGEFCEFHKPSRLCKVPECRKCAKTGGYCISHGGGRRCHVEKCMKSAKEGGYCIAHGGGKRCKEGGCTKSALAGGLCSAHGGGKRCKASYCVKTALKGGLCIAHGGGRRCEVEDCTKSAVGGQLCVSHGGGRRCREDGCDKGAVRHGVCIRHGARRS